MSIELSKLERKAFSIPEAAAVLSLSAVTIRRMVKSGTLKTVRATPRGTHRIPVVEIDRFLSMTGTSNELNS